MCVAASMFAVNPKREFRGAWLHVIGQTQWQNKTTEQAKAYICDQFDKLQCGNLPGASYGRCGIQVGQRALECMAHGQARQGTLTPLGSYALCCCRGA